MPRRMLIDPSQVSLALDTQFDLRWRFLSRWFSRLSRPPWQAPRDRNRERASRDTKWDAAGCRCITTRSSWPGSSRPFTLFAQQARTWMPGTSPGTTGRDAILALLPGLMRNEVRRRVYRAPGSRRAWRSICSLANTVDRHGRACPGHPRSFAQQARTWMPGTSPGMTGRDATRRFASSRCGKFTPSHSRGANASELCEHFRLSMGRGECRVPTHPQPRMQSKKAYELVTTGKPDDPAFPHAMVLTVSFVISPVIGLVCHRRFAVDPQSLTPASRRQDHTTSPSAFSPVRQRCLIASIASRPASVTIASAPLVGRDGPIRKVFCRKDKRIYFFDRGWTGDLPVRHERASDSREPPPDWPSASHLRASFARL